MAVWHSSLASTQHSGVQVAAVQGFFQGMLWNSESPCFRSPVKMYTSVCFLLLFPAVYHMKGVHISFLHASSNQGDGADIISPRFYPVTKVFGIPSQNIQHNTNERPQMKTLKNSPKAMIAIACPYGILVRSMSL
jgi:hypothetical protein